MPKPSGSIWSVLWRQKHGRAMAIATGAFLLFALAILIRGLATGDDWLVTISGIGASVFACFMLAIACAPRIDAWSRTAAARVLRRPNKTLGDARDDVVGGILASVISTLAGVLTLAIVVICVWAVLRIVTSR